VVRGIGRKARHRPYRASERIYLMVARKRLHTTPGEDVKITAGKGKKKSSSPGGRGHATAKRIAAQEKKKKRQHAVDVRSGRIASQKPSFSSKLRTAAARVPLALAYGARGGGGGAGRK